jgi:ubiquitin-protein ligase
MNDTSNQLESVFKKVTEYFANTPDITVTPGEGTAPELYTITYKRTGACKKPGGKIYICSTHVISIAIPFGFPLLPPKCQPESPTFHPDFDYSSIFIDDFWKADQSIVKLILHLDKMISGEIYSEASAVNEEAAEWYKINSHRLPFKKAHSKQNTLAGSDTKTERSSSYTVDTIDDAIFEQSFSLEKTTPPDLGIDTDLMRLLARQKRFHALSGELQKFDDPFDGRAAIEEETQSALNKSMVLFQEANELEHQGKQQETLEKLRSIEKLVTDDPLVRKAKKRVQQAFDLLGDWVSEKQNEIPAKSGSSDTASSSKAIIEEITSENRTKFFLALGGSAFVLCAIVIASFFFCDSNLKKGTNRYSECQRLLDANTFRDAEQKCEEALELLTNIYVFKQDQKNQLTQKIRSLLDSPKLRQGLAGKTILNGKYVTPADRELILEFRKTMEKGNSFFTNERWNEAARSFNQALALTKKIDLTDPDTLADLHENITRTKIYLSIEKGKEAFATSQWDTAIIQYEKAIKLLAANATQLKGIDVEKTGDKLARILLHATIIRDRQKVVRFLKAKQYDPAARRLQAIKQTITASQFADQPEFKTILQEISSQIDDTEQQLLVVNLEKYLTNNYKTLFLKHYPSATRSKLSKPRVEYLENKVNNLLFRIQCTEITSGRPLRLQMDYLYSPANGSWRFYSEE